MELNQAGFQYNTLKSLKLKMFSFLTKQKQINQVENKKVITQTLKLHEGPKMYFKITLVSNETENIKQQISFMV